MVKRTEARCLPGYPAPSAPSGRRIEPGTHSPPILEQSGYCKIGNSYLKQQNNHPRQKLRNLLIKRKMNIPKYASCINLSYLSTLWIITVDVDLIKIITKTEVQKLNLC